MKYILASDIDGTILVNEEISNEALKSIKKLKEAGHSFILCTGRDFSNTKIVFEKYNLPIDGLVLCNGAFILDNHFHVYFEDCIKKETVESIYKAFNEKTDYYLACVDGYEIYMDRWPAFIDQMSLRVNKITKESMHKQFDKIKLISLIILDASVERVEEIKNELNEKYGEDIVAYRNQTFIDIVPKGCSKATGIERLMKKLKSTKEQICVIGDSWNDLSMFEGYSRSYTFNHAEDELKSYVKHTVDTFEECINHLLDNK